MPSEGQAQSLPQGTGCASGKSRDRCDTVVGLSFASCVTLDKSLYPVEWGGDDNVFHTQLLGGDREAVGVKVRELCVCREGTTFWGGPLRCPGLELKPGGPSSCVFSPPGVVPFVENI